MNDSHPLIHSLIPNRSTWAVLSRRTEARGSCGGWGVDVLFFLDEWFVLHWPAILPCWLQDQTSLCHCWTTSYPSTEIPLLLRGGHFFKFHGGWYRLLVHLRLTLQENGNWFPFDKDGRYSKSLQWLTCSRPRLHHSNRRTEATNLRYSIYDSFRVF